MKLIEQASLSFQQGNSDKIYEAEICEVGNNEFVVNFRYGRRGSTLKEGTKTVFPVSYEEAKKVFDNLVNSKTVKGYEHADAISSNLKPVKSAQSKDNLEEREEKILSYLKQAVNGTYDESQWKLSRVIWRVGELKMSEAEGSLREISFQQDELFNYSLLWALGRCGSQKVVSKIKNAPDSQATHLERIKLEAIVNVGDRLDRSEVIRKTLERLPSTMRDLVKSKEPLELEKHLREILFELGSAKNDFLPDLYLLTYEYDHLHKVLCAIINDLPLKPNFFKYIRYIFKASEFRDDTMMYSIIASRFEKQVQFFNTSPWGDIWIDGEYVKVEAEAKKSDAKLAYSDKTRNYFKNRISRWLNKLGQVQDATYVQYAKDILLKFADSDSQGPSQFVQYHYDWNTSRSSTSTTHFDAFSEYIVLYNILYKNSIRYELNARAKKWNCRPPFTPGKPIPNKREEAFPELWDKAPEQLVALLKSSQCQIVQQFAVKAFSANPDRQKYIDVTLILELLQKPYIVNNQLGITLAQEVYDPENPNIELVSALLTCSFAEANELAIQWIEEKRSYFLNQTEFLTALITCPNKTVQDWAKNQLATVSWDDKIANEVLTAVLNQLLMITLNEEDDEHDMYINRVTEIILLTFPDQLKKIDFEIINRLLTHEIPANQVFGAKILLKHETSAESLPDELFEKLITSDHAEVRAVGVALFGKLDEASLLKKKDILINFCISKYPEVRREAQPVVKKLVNANAHFGNEITELFLPLMWRQEEYEGLQKDLLAIFLNELNASLEKIPANITWKLIDCAYLPGNELGSEILKKAPYLQDESISNLVSLASHDLLALRQLCWDYYKSNTSRIKYEAEQALKIVDAKWEDSRSFAFSFIEDKFTADDWNPTLLIGICDSTREEVQEFGKRLLTRFFKEEDGLEYMLKLSQHPNTGLQLFVSNYTERFTSGQPERLFQLEYYYTSVLSQINKGRTSKERAFQFLNTEALQHVEVAEWLLPLLTRISLTVTKKDKAHCIRIMFDLKKKYPHLESPLIVKEIDTI